ncbi:hypothetical protein D3C87_516560 [compost metagenome]
MKKILLTVLILCFVSLANAQISKDTTNINSKTNGDHELKFNLAYAVAGLLELNYENIIKDDMSIGVAALVGLEKDTKYKFGLMPNFRIYFGSKKANGFFVEGNMAFVISSEYKYDINYTYSDISYSYTSYERATNYMNFGMGIAAGGKFLTKSGFVGEIYGGVGRLFGDSNVDVYPRAGITIGKRF